MARNGSSLGNVLLKRRSRVQLYFTELLPIQEEAVKRGKILDGKNVVIFSPTSLGKTFVGEMTAVRMAQKPRRLIGTHSAQ